MAEKRKDRGDEEPERRLKADPGGIPSQQPLTEADADRLVSIAGFERAELFERRGHAHRWGLVQFLEPGDRVAEVYRDHAVIVRQDGTRQTWWNLRRHPPWVRVSGPAGA